MTVIQISTQALTSVIRRKLTDAFVDLTKPATELNQTFLDALTEDIAASIVERATAVTAEPVKTWDEPEKAFDEPPTWPAWSAPPRGRSWLARAEQGADR